MLNPDEFDPASTADFTAHVLIMEAMVNDRSLPDEQRQALTALVKRVKYAQHLEWRVRRETKDKLSRLETELEIERSDRWDMIRKLEHALEERDELLLELLAAKLAAG